MLSQVLQDNGFSKKEADLYLICLEMWTAPVSSIARRAKENRVTVYSVLKNLAKKWIIIEEIKNKSRYYSAISPQSLLDKYQQKYEKLKEKLPEFMAIANKYDNKPQVQFFEGLEGLKTFYEWVILYGGEGMGPDEPYLTFTWTWNMDPGLERYLAQEFIPWRLKFPRKTMSILSGKSDNKYMKYHETSHNTLTINDPIFNFADEIIIYGGDKVSITMYDTNEMCGLVISSKTLHNGLKSMFNLIRKLHKTGKRTGKRR